MSQILLRDAVLREDFPAMCRLEIMPQCSYLGDFCDDAAVCLAFLKMINGGLHHLHSIKVEGRMVKCLIYDQVASYDSRIMTNMVLMAHAFAVRVQVSNGGPNMMRIRAWRRSPIRRDDCSAFHPGLEELKTRIDQLLLWTMEAGDQ